MLVITLPALFIGYDFLIIVLAYSGFTALLPNFVWLIITLLAWSAFLGISIFLVQKFRKRKAWVHLVIIVAAWIVAVFIFLGLPAG